MTPEPAVLEVADLKTHIRTPKGVVRAVDGVSFSIAPGKTLGIVGESGSGKTVLARSIMNLLGGRGIRRHGSVRFDGREISGFTDAQMRPLWGAEIAMVFQDPMTSLNPVMKIGRQLTEGLEFHLHLDKQDALRRAVELLRLVGIPDPERRMHQYPFELSGGMRQRITIAIAISCRPKLLIADEPTTALDATVQLQILDLLEDLQRDRDMAMILVSHDLGVVAGRTDDTAVMYAGKIVEIAPTARLFTEMRMPYTEALMRSMPSLTAQSHTRLDTIPGRPPSLVDLPPGCHFAPRCPYAQSRCSREAPDLVGEQGLTPGHRFACWYPVTPPVRRAEAQRPGPTGQPQEPTAAGADRGAPA